MQFRNSGFEQFNRERRKFSGRRIGSERRMLPDRRADERRVGFQPVTQNHRSGVDRRSGFDRRAGERRVVEDRRNGAWRMLSGE